MIYIQKSQPVKNQKRTFRKKSKNQTIIFYKTFLKPIWMYGQETSIRAFIDDFKIILIP